MPSSVGAISQGGDSGKGQSTGRGWMGEGVRGAGGPPVQDRCKKHFVQSPGLSESHQLCAFALAAHLCHKLPPLHPCRVAELSKTQVQLSRSSQGPRVGAGDAASFRFGPRPLPGSLCRISASPNPGCFSRLSSNRAPP